MGRYIAAALLAITATYSFADESMQKFSDYPVKEIYKGKHAQVKPDPDSTEHFNKNLVAAGAQPVDFAGHYIVFRYSPGGGAITASVLDAVTGKVVAGFPDAYVGGDEPESFDARYEADSTLMIVTGESASGKGEGIETHCYDFKNNKFKEIKCKK